ncbi:hypothetical protein ACGF12_22770 [Kitasatospora sp. NPDC048296]|uniref:hypothetical protein n=1 Tax=Kitasatospora sp. NPDC048296 TaxID=3364048 RepID=UPI0037100B57
MTTAGGVRVDHASIERDLEERGHDGCQIEYVPEQQHPGGGAELLDAVQAAVAAANGDGAEGAMWGQAPALTLAGAGVSLKDYWGPDSLTSWLDAFARALAVHGLTGRVAATPAVMPPRWFRFGAEPRAGAFLALERPLTERTFAEPWCQSAYAWAGRSGGEAHLAAGAVLQRVPSTDVARYLARSLANTRTTLAYLDPDRPRASRVWAQDDGLAVLQVYDPAAGWEALVKRARDAVLANAARARLAFIDMTPKWSYGWEDRGRELPAVPVHAVYNNDPLWARRLPDVHAIQLLNSTHLNQAVDLSGWTITEVNPGRYLVEARDLAAWCAQGAPSEAVLAQARADFGPALATPEDLS